MFFAKDLNLRGIVDKLQGILSSLPSATHLFSTKNSIKTTFINKNGWRSMEILFLFKLMCDKLMFNGADFCFEINIWGSNIDLCCRQKTGNEPFVCFILCETDFWHQLIVRKTKIAYPTDVPHFK